MSSQSSSKNRKPPETLFSAGSYQKLVVNHYRVFQGNTSVSTLNITSGGYASIDGSDMPLGADKNKHGIVIQRLAVGYGGEAITRDAYVANLVASNFGKATLYKTVIDEATVKLGAHVRIDSDCAPGPSFITVTSSGTATVLAYNMNIKVRDGGVAIIGDYRTNYTDSGCRVEAMTGGRVHVRNHTGRVALFHNAWCEIHSGGDVHHGGVAYDGGFVISNGGTLSNTSALSGGVIHCMPGGSMSHVYISSGASVILHGDCHVFDLHVLSGGEMRLVNFSSGCLEDVTIEDGGRMRTIRQVYDDYEHDRR